MKKQKAKRILIPVIVLAALCLAGALLYAIINSRTFMFFGKLTDHVQTQEKEVFLTFDDGPSKRTPDILKTLDELGVKASFFLIGKEMERYPEYAKQIADAGHDIGNHSYSHTRMIFKSLDFIKTEVEKTNQIIRQSGYKKEIFFRMPNCKKLFILPWYLAHNNIRSVTWNIEPESSPDTAKDAWSMAADVKKHLQPGAIILLHPMDDDTGKTLEAIRLIVNEAKEQGYVFKTLSEGI